MTIAASLFTSYYPEKNPVRRREIDECLRRNADCELLQRICLYVEGGATAPVKSPRILTRQIAHRPTYRDFFCWVNELSRETDTAIVANSDICLHRSVGTLLRRLDADTCAALSRWDLLPNGAMRLFNRGDSQDAWVFRGPVKPVLSDFCVGIPRCDNRILHELRAAGYRVINPAFSVKVLHLHHGERMEYPAVINGASAPPPYAYLSPHNLFSLPETVLWNLRHPLHPVAWRPDIRQLPALAGRAIRWIKNRDSFRRKVSE